MSEFRSPLATGRARFFLEPPVTRDTGGSPISGGSVTAIDLSAYAGQTITLKFQAVNDSTLPTSFFVDVVSVMV